MQGKMLKWHLLMQALTMCLAAGHAACGSSPEPASPTCSGARSWARGCRGRWRQAAGGCPLEAQLPCHHGKITSQ